MKNSNKSTNTNSSDKYTHKHNCNNNIKKKKNKNSPHPLVQGVLDKQHLGSQLPRYLGILGTQVLGTQLLKQLSAAPDPQRLGPPQVGRRRAAGGLIGVVAPWEASKVMNVSRIAAPTPPELEFWRGRGLQTPTGPMDRDFGSSLSLQDKLVELPNTSSSHRAAFMALILSPPRPRRAPSWLPASFETTQPPNPRSSRKLATPLIL